MSEIFSVALITVLAVISPGADFALVTRNSYLYGQKSGFLTTLGIGLGVQIHVLYALIGVGVLLSQQPILFDLLKILGAAYLTFVGYQTFFSPAVSHDMLDKNAMMMAPWQSIKLGFFTNALNPKTTLFVLSTYAQIVNPNTPLGLQYAYGLFMSATHWAWFALVCAVFSSPVLRSRMLTQQKPINRVIGGILAALGCGLAATAFAH
ncbi:MAG: LysE family translocator [Formosimonas sp.]